MDDLLATRLMEMLCRRLSADDPEVQNSQAVKWAVDDELEPTESFRVAGERGWIEQGKRPGTIRVTTAGWKIGTANG